MTFEVRKGDTTVSSVWTNSVRNAFRKQAGWAKLQEARTAAAKHWTERVWYRHNQRWMQASKEGTEAAKSGSFKDLKILFHNGDLNPLWPGGGLPAAGGGRAWAAGAGSGPMLMRV
jgi:hypothetical protein